MSSPQRSKRARTLRLCPDCGQKIINRGAHYEACPGTLAGADERGNYRDSGSYAATPGPASAPASARRCEHRVPSGHGVWRYCVRPWNHEGEHIY